MNKYKINQKIFYLCSINGIIFIESMFIEEIFIINENIICYKGDHYHTNIFTTRGVAEKNLFETYEDALEDLENQLNKLKTLYKVKLESRER